MDESFCDTCCVSKHHKLPFSLSSFIADCIFELIHVDLWGPYRTPIISKQKYYLTIVDDHSRVTWIYLLLDKEHVKSVILEFLAYVLNHYGVAVKKVRSDNGTEIVQKECLNIFASHGISHQRSSPKTPQQNGRVERKHRHLVETARVMRIHAGLSIKFSGECILSATHINNLLPTGVLGWKTPFEILMKRRSNYDHLRVIGCLCYAPNNFTQGDKFAAKGVRSVLLGYPSFQKAYKLYDLDHSNIIVSRDVVFKE
ncbi:Retrovirus-related Pol polyprotein from transposon TNT 1-94 [Bienertia sinuspersici]